MLKLREQLAGLLQAMLQQQRRGGFDANVNRLIESVETLHRIIEYQSAAKDAASRDTEDILLSRHPVLTEVRRALGWSSCSYHF